MSAIGLIPARYDSSRLPGKLLLAETGKPLLQHTWEAAHQAKGLDRVIVATDSEEIARVAAHFGAEVCMTGECANGTERIAEAVQRLDIGDEIVVNIQGDEPEIDPRHIDLCIQSLDNHRDCEMATLANPIQSALQLRDPACVKVVTASDGKALYFSRAPIPFARDKSAEEWFQGENQYEQPPWLQHIGLYAYRLHFLNAFVQMPATTLENCEQLEQLRALQAGAGIHVSVVRDRSIGIDTPADYEAFVQRWKTTHS